MKTIERATDATTMTPAGSSARRVFFMLIAICLALGAARHPFHTTVAEIELDEETATLEIAMRAEGFVVEEMLTLRHARRVDLDKTADVDALLFAEVKRCFRVETSYGVPVELNWVGKEVGERELWLYFEASLPEGLHGVTIENTWGFTFADDQVNTLNVRQGPHRQTLEATLAAPAGRVTMSDVHVVETLLWMSKRARSVPAPLAAQLKLRCAEIALDLGDRRAATRNLARAWPFVEEGRVDGSRRILVFRGLTAAARLARLVEAPVLAARIEEHLAKKPVRIDATLVADITQELELGTP